MCEPFELVRLPNGAWGIRSTAYREVCHPGVGPKAEAEAIYVQGLNLPSRMRSAKDANDEFVVWDVGLGGGANALAAINAGIAVGARLRVVSFDLELGQLAFARRHAAELDYLYGRVDLVSRFVEAPTVHLEEAGAVVEWSRILGDFPVLLSSAETSGWPAPDAIFWDPHSPSANPEMWTLPLFARLAARLDPQRPCSLATYSRSTAVRVTMLLAGWYVGSGACTPAKEDSTVAANVRELLRSPLGEEWFQRARRSHSAEPWVESPFQARPLSPESLQRLERHPQFRGVEDRRAH